MKYQYITVNGKEVEYVMFGKGPVLLFLHGALLRVTSFSKILEKLSERYTVIAPNIPGHGKSEPLRSMKTLKSIAKHLDEFLKEIKVKPRYIVGYSLGGGIGFELTKIRKFRKFVAVDPFVFPVKHTIPEFLKIFSIKIPKFMTDNGISPKDLEELRKDSLGNIWEIKSHIPKMYSDFLELYSKNKVNVGDVDTPTLLLWGKDDELFPVKDATKIALSSRFIEYEIVEGNHTWLRLYPDVLVTKINKYCRTKFFWLERWF